jgi:hypothetical protein
MSQIRSDILYQRQIKEVNQTDQQIKRQLQLHLMISMIQMINYKLLKKMKLKN